MKKQVLPLLTLALIFTAASCKKDPYSASDSDQLTYESSNNFVINPTALVEDTSTSIIALEKIDFLCDIEDNRIQNITTPKEDYVYDETNLLAINVLSFQMEERWADPEFESLGEWLIYARLEIYHSDYQDIQTVGICNEVNEIGISYDRMTFDIQSADILNYIKAHPDYRFRVVHKFHSGYFEPRLFTYNFEVMYSADHFYEKE